MAVRVNKGLMHEIVGTRETPLVLSIQSHVIHGYVGNKVAAFALQTMGIHVDFINSVQFISQFNHHGSITTQQDLQGYIEQLKESNLTRYSHILTGFIGSVGYLQEICKMVLDFKRKSLDEGYDNVIWVCDPVLGDRGEIYTAKGLRESFRDDALSVADVITPNHYELMWLTGRDKLDTLDDVVAACDELHERGVGCVVVTSVPLKEGTLTLVASSNPVNQNKQCFFAPTAEQPRRRFKIDFENKDVQLYGTGDLTASALLKSIHKEGLHRIDKACARALFIVQEAIRATFEYTPEGKTPVELDIVSARRELMNAADHEDVPFVAVEF